MPPLMSNEAAAHALERIGIRWQDVVFRKVEMLPDNSIVYRVPGKVGPRVVWSAAPIKYSKMIPNLIGYLYIDGQLRNDAEMICKVGLGEGFGGIEAPQFVVFWKKDITPYVRFDHGWTRLRQKPMIVVAKR